MSWGEGYVDEAAVAARDQSDAEMIEIIRDARLAFLVAMPSSEDGPEAVVRGLCALPQSLDDEERSMLIAEFLVTARRELDEMIEALT